MTDDDLEQLIRATLTEDAERAPRVDDLAQQVAAAHHHSRRHQALTVTSLSAAAAAAAVAAVAVSGSLGAGIGGAGRTVTPGVPSSTSTSAATPTPRPGTYRDQIPSDTPKVQPAKPFPPKPTPLTGAAARMALEQEAVDRQGQRLQTFLDAHDATNLAVMVHLRDPSRLKVLWKGPIPAALRSFASTLPTDVPVVFQSVTYSAADWKAATQALFAAHGYDKRRPRAWSVNEVNPTQNFSGLEVFVQKDRSDFPDPNLREVRRVLTAISPMPISNVTLTKDDGNGWHATWVGPPPYDSSGTPSPKSAPSHAK